MSLAAWFRDQGVTVNEVYRKPFQEAVKPKLTGEGVPYTMEQFERLQAL